MINREFGLFVVNGYILFTSGYGIYFGLVASELKIEIANCTANLAGMVYGLFANKRLALRDGVGEASMLSLHATI